MLPNDYDEDRAHQAAGVPSLLEKVSSRRSALLTQSRKFPPSRIDILRTCENLICSIPSFQNLSEDALIKISDVLEEVPQPVFFSSFKQRSFFEKCRV